MHSRLVTLTDYAGRVHARQRSWATWQRACWWVLLLPAALACWASVQISAPEQRVRWGLTAASLVLVGISAVSGCGSSGDDTPTAEDAASASVAALEADVTSSAAPVASKAAPAPRTTTKSPAVTTVSPAADARALTAGPAAPGTPVPTNTASKPLATRMPVATVSAKPAPVVTAAPVETASSAKEYQNCTELRKTHPHGVGQPGAQDSTSGTPPVTTFTVSADLYDANTKSDRDSDGIACEQL